MTSDDGGIILLALLDAGMEIRVATATLTAEAAGGLSRASYILPGSAPDGGPGGLLVAVAPVLSRVRPD